MAPPTYGDLGKSSRDIFGKGYHFGVCKLDIKSSTKSGVNFSYGGVMNSETSKISGNVETKYKVKDYGLTFTEKWSTDDNLNVNIDVENQLINGLKLTLDSCFKPITGEKKGKVKGVYKHDLVTIDGDVNVCATGPLVNASAVVAHKGWLGGYQMAFDSGKSKLVKSNFAIGYSNGEFVVHTNVNDGNVFTGSLYQKVNDKVETGVNCGWTASSSSTTFGIGLKYKIDQMYNIRAKVNNSGQIGLGLQHKLRDGVTLTMSTLLNGKNLNEGGNKVGFGLEVEA